MRIPEDSWSGFEVQGDRKRGGWIKARDVKERSWILKFRFTAWKLVHPP